MNTIKYGWWQIYLQTVDVPEFVQEACQRFSDRTKDAAETALAARQEENPHEFVTPSGESILENRAALLDAVSAAEASMHNAEVPHGRRRRQSKSNTVRCGRTTARHKSFTARQNAQHELQEIVVQDLDTLGKRRGSSHPFQRPVPHIQATPSTDSTSCD
jgi:hypothetical protein